jgi:RNA polymerase sigma-70 factor, ECF subfamily
MVAVAKSESYVQASHDRPLVEQCINGDEGAWSTLHRQYFPVAVAFLRRLGVRDADIEDAAQEVFLQVFRYLARFREQAEFRTWLYQLCISQTRRMRRTYFVKDVLKRVLVHSPPDALVSGPGFCEKAAQQRMDAALAKLSEAERAVFVLYEMQGVPGKDIARIVGAKEATVWRRLHYARRSVQAALGLETEDPS